MILRIILLILILLALWVVFGAKKVKLSAPWLIKAIIALVVIGLLVWGIRATWGWWEGRESSTTTAYNATQVAPSAPPEYSSFGEGIATKEVGIKAYLDPMKSHTRPSRSAKYVFVEDTLLTWTEIVGDDLSDADIQAQLRAWWKRPAGNYIIYPVEGDKIFFRWWQ